jgi:signal transduction histidine kinase
MGIAVAMLMVWLGALQLREVSDKEALARAERLASACALRLRASPEEERQIILEHIGRRTGTDLLLVNQQGQILADTTVGSPPLATPSEMLIINRGFTEISTGRAAFVAQQLSSPLNHIVLITFVHAPSTPIGLLSLVKAVAGMAVILIGVAVYVAYSLSKYIQDDVDYVRWRIDQMGEPGGERVAEEVPVRAFDQVGEVTSAFNILVGRFLAAQRAYNYDLAQADALDSARARFLAVLSHELRTPLNAILGFADVLLSEVDGPLTESAREDIEVIRASGERLRALISDVLDLSAMEVGTLRLERKQVDLYKIAEEIIRESSAQLNGKAVNLRLHGKPETYCWADSQRVLQILANLIGNAIKFTQEGFVEVRLVPRQDSVRVEVLDTGPGIEKSQVDKIFEEFGQAGDVHSRRKGTGLGLAIARRLVLMHGGKIGVQSQVGKGSRFVIELPKKAGTKL